MAVILNTTEPKWLSDFYSEQQSNSWSALITDNFSENALTRKILPWLQQVEGSGDKFFTVIPNFKSNGEIICWYGVATSAQLFSQLNDDLNSFIGATYCTFENIDDISSGKHERILKDRFGDNVVRFTPFGNSEEEKVEDLLDTYLKVINRRPPVTQRPNRPFFNIRADLDRALLARNEDHAEKLIKELGNTGRLDSTSNHFIEIRKLAGLGYTKKLASDLDLLTKVKPLELPRQVIIDISTALYETYIKDHENESQEIVRKYFIENIHRPYGSSFFRYRKSIKDPITLRLFLLAQLVQDEPDQSKIDGIVSAYSENAEGYNLILRWAEWLKPTSTLPVAKPQAPRDLVEAAILDDDWERVKDICLDNIKEEDWFISRLLRCTDHLNSKQLSQTIVAHIASLDDSRKSNLKPRDRERLKKINRNLDLNRNLDIEIPNSIYSWIVGVENNSLGEDPVGVLKESMHTWRISDLQKNSMQCNKIADLIVNADKTQEEIYNNAFVFLVQYFTDNLESPERNFAPIYASLITVLAWRGGLTEDELEILSSLTIALLNAAPSSEVYEGLISDLEDILKANESPQHIDWMLNISELLILHPSQGNDDLRLTLFTCIIDYFLSISHRILSPQKEILKTLTKDFHCPDLMNSFPEEEEDDKGEVVRENYSGYIGIYTLTDGAAQRSSALLKKYYPQARVEVNNDHAATDRLKSLARNADIFVFAWKSSKHQAYYCAKTARKDEILMPPGKGSASIIKCVMDNIY